MNKQDIFPIGIGTWKIDCENFKEDLDSLLYSYYRGQNYLSLYMLYNNGEVVKKISEFVACVDRDKLFINVNLEPTIKKVSDIEKQLDDYLSILHLDYVDSLQLHSPFYSEIPLLDVYQEIKRLVLVGKVRYIGISNVHLEQLKEINEKVNIDFFEGVYNLECKYYEDSGVIDFCRKNHIQFIAYQTLRRNRTAKHNYAILVELAQKYEKTQNQIILNWIMKEKGIFPLIKSTNKLRIDENLNALGFVMEKEDYGKLNAFRSEEFDRVLIDWDRGDGVVIDQLANQFD